MSLDCLVVVGPKQQVYKYNCKELSAAAGCHLTETDVSLGLRPAVSVAMLFISIASKKGYAIYLFLAFFPSSKRERTGFYTYFLVLN